MQPRCPLGTRRDATWVPPAMQPRYPPNEAGPFALAFIPHRPSPCVMVLAAMELTPRAGGSPGGWGPLPGNRRHNSGKSCLFSRSLSTKAHRSHDRHSDLPPAPHALLKGHITGPRCLEAMQPGCTRRPPPPPRVGVWPYYDPTGGAVASIAGRFEKVAYQSLSLGWLARHGSCAKRWSR